MDRNQYLRGSRKYPATKLSPLARLYTAEGLIAVDLPMMSLLRIGRLERVKDGFRSHHCEQAAVHGHRPVQLFQCLIVLSDAH